MTEKLRAQGLFKVFGDRAEDALRLARAGVDTHEILQTIGQVVAVSGVDLSVAAGEIFIVMGLSGSGKSTLVRCLNRLIEPTAGSVTVDGEDVVAMPKPRLREIRRTKISMVFQSFALLPHKSVLENVELGLRLRGEAPDQCRRKSRAALEQVGLSEWGERYPESLSGGMKQRVGLARALASDPDILLMDEPFSALDPLIRADLQDELIQLQDRIKKTIVFITHDFHEAMKLGDRIAVMRDGNFVQVGTPQEIVVNSANDYVRNFAREVDRGRVFSANDVSQMRVPVLALDGGVEEARKEVSRRDARYAVFVDAERQPLGYLTNTDLCSGSPRNGTGIADRLRTDLPVAAGGKPLIELYAECADFRPVAVVDGDGRVTGAIDSNDVLLQISRSAARAETSSRDPAPADGEEAR